MTKDEALTLARDWIAERPADRPVSAGKMISIIDRALAQPEQEPVLQDIEQYRLQMAGISTAAIGYWKEGDGIHPDYDTLALRDVAKLYSKYDELYKAQPEQEPVGFAVMERPWVGLTGQEKVLVASVSLDVHDAVHRTAAKLKAVNGFHSTEKNT